MSPERDELMRLVQQSPDDQVPDVLHELRRHLRRCVELFTGLRLANRQLLVPSVAFTLLPTAESRPYRWAVRQPSA